MVVCLFHTPESMLLKVKGCTALCPDLLDAQAQASYSIALPLQPRSRLTHSGDGSAVGHKTKAVLEDSTAIEGRDGTSNALVSWS